MRFLILVLSVTFSILWQNSVCWAGCWNTARNQNVKIWFEDCATSINGNCNNQCMEFNWTGGSFDHYAHGAGEIIFYQSEKIIKKTNQILYFGAYEKQSIKKLSNGDEYIGETKDVFFNGHGVYLKKNGDKYLGHFINGKPSGFLSYYTASTINYRGQWKDGLKSGAGILYEKNRVIEGFWENGKLHGLTIFKFQDGTVVEANYSNGSLMSKARITYPNNDVYEGQIASDFSRNGYGIYRYNNGDEYNGQWFNNKQSGQGKYIVKGNAINNGKWSKGKLLDSEKHSETYPNNEKYIGEIKNGKRDGFGIYYFNDGSTYEGAWLNGKKYGKGKYTLPDKRYYEGDWKDDKRHGLGLFVFKDGSEYQGQWKDDKRTGKGNLSFNDGTEYEGDWLDGAITGKGILELADGSFYSGDFKNNKKNGKGIFVWSDGSSYEGTWKDDTPHGKGIYAWINGDQYEGFFNEGYLYGTGTFFYANNDQYEGSFSSGQKSGYGKYFFANGNVYEGDFVDGQPNGAGIFTFNDGTRYEGGFSDGKFYGDGSLYINQGKSSSMVYTGSWDGTNKLPKMASILFENGDLFEGETDGNGRPTSNGEWTTLAERESGEKTPLKQDSIHKANEFYKKHKESIETAVLITSSALTVLSLIPVTAPVAAPLLIGLNIADAVIETSSKSVDIHDAYKTGDIQKAKELSKELGQNLAVNGAFIIAPKVLKTPAKAVARGLRPVAKSIIKQAKRYAKRIVVKTDGSKVIKAFENATYPARTASKYVKNAYVRSKSDAQILAKAKTKQIINKQAKYLQSLSKIRLTDSQMHEVKVDLIKAIKNYTNKPSASGFEEFFARISPERAKQLLNDDKVRKQVAYLIRAPGGQHEWLMVKNFEDFLTNPKWKNDKYKLIASMKRLTNATADVMFKKGGGHGGMNSTAWHNRLKAEIDKSMNYEDVMRHINAYAKRTLTIESYEKFIQMMGNMI